LKKSRQQNDAFAADFNPKTRGALGASPTKRKGRSASQGAPARSTGVLSSEIVGSALKRRVQPEDSSSHEGDGADKDAEEVPDENAHESADGGSENDATQVTDEDIDEDAPAAGPSHARRLGKTREGRRSKGRATTTHSSDDGDSEVDERGVFEELDARSALVSKAGAQVRKAGQSKSQRAAPRSRPVRGLSAARLCYNFILTILFL
jgi:hypothetical protein